MAYMNLLDCRKMLVENLGKRQMVNEVLDSAVFVIVARNRFAVLDKTAQVRFDFASLLFGLETHR